MFNCLYNDIGILQMTLVN